MPDPRVLCPTCGYLVRPEHFPCKRLVREINNNGSAPKEIEAAGWLESEVVETDES